jgi:lipopolysaccharide export system protein LptA
MARIIRIGGSLAITLVAYLLYAQVVVRLIEPEASRSDSDSVSEAALAEARNAVDRRIAALSDLFPPGSWELENPKILESDQFKLLLRDYKNQGDGTVRISPCTMIFMPEPSAVEPDSSGREAVILRAPEGALLRFDKPFDLRRANIGRLESGQLTGPITIRSDGREPGPDDDLRIVTRDVQMNEQLVWTPHEVEFRMGPNYGQGRQMRIKLLPGRENSGEKVTHGPNVAGIESFELLTLDRLHLQFGQSAPGAVPTPSKSQSQTPVQAGGRSPRGQGMFSGGNAEDDLPVEITCRGPFRLDLTGQVATFEDRVDVMRLRPNGPSDQLNCELLSVFFVQKNDAEPADGHDRDDAPPDDESDDDRGMASLQPQRIEARGEPVVVRAPVEQVEARGQLLEYNLQTGRILLEGDKEVYLVQGPNEIHARSLQYEPDQRGRLGPLVAEGPGWIRAQTAEQPDRQLEARWKEQLRIRRHQKSQVISLTGTAALNYRAVGELTAEEIHFWMLESPPEAPEYDLQPDRMLARRDVRLESAQLSGAVDRLEVWFESDPNAPGGRWEAEDAGRTLQGRLAPNRGANSQSMLPLRRSRDGLLKTDYRTAAAPSSPPAKGPLGRHVGGGPPVPITTLPPRGQDVTGRAQVSVAARRPSAYRPAAPSVGRGTDNRGPKTVAVAPRQGRAARPPVAGPVAAGHMTAQPGARPNAGPLAPGQHFRIVGKVLRAQVLLSEAESELSELMVEGDVELRETQTRLPDERPMIVQGDKLHVVDASKPHAAVTVVGTPAHFEARGLGLTSSNINLNRGTNRLWIDGPGEMDLPMTEDFEGRPMQGAGPLRVHWQDRMTFDGHAARFEGSIVAAAKHQRLETETLETVFRQPIRFAQPQPQTKPELHQLRCRGGVFLASRTEDARGQTSFERVEVTDLVINLASGALNAGGPGLVTTVRRGATDLMRSRDAAEEGDPGRGSSQEGNRLTFLRVSFQNSITGNVHRREMTFHEQVRAVYGPIDSWDTVLSADDPDALGPRGVLLSCNQLSVTEMVTPLENGRAVELEAAGNTLIEGSTFTARAGRVTFAEAKDLLVLEGNGRTEAELFRQEYPGGPTSEAAAQKILYWPTSNRLKVDGARSLELSQFRTPEKPR